MFKLLLREIRSSDQSRLHSLKGLFKSNLSINLLLVLTGLLLFLPRLNLELKLDELGSFWVIKDSFLDAVERSLHLGQSPLYYLILWSFHKIFGSSEIALRLPSLICILTASLLMIRLGALLLSREVGVFSAFVFLGSIQAIVAATDARPYALGLVLTILSTIYLVEWCTKGEKKYLLKYCLFLAATIYAHYLFGLIFLVHAAWVLVAARQSWKSLIKQAIWGGLGLLILTLPALYHVKVFAAKTAGKAFVKLPTIFDLTISLLPIESLLLITLLIIFQTLAWRNSSRWSFFKDPILKTSLYPIFAFLLLPVLIIYIISIFSGNSIFIERYFGQRVIGLGLLGGVIICSFTHSTKRILLLSCMILIIAINQYSYGFSNRAGDGFGRAVNRIRLEDQGGECQLFIMSGFIESQTISWLREGLTREFILSPLSYYKVSNPVTPIPYSFSTSDAEEYYSKEVKRALENASCIWLLYRNMELYIGDQGLTPAPLALEQELLDKLGFHQLELTVHGFVELVGYRAPSKAEARTSKTIDQQLQRHSTQLKGFQFSKNAAAYSLPGPSPRDWLYDSLGS